jgi:rRNA-processing protein FCF1
MGDVKVTEQSVRIIITDASVLIDYMKADPGILQSVSTNIGEVHVHKLAFEEVDQIDEQEVIRLGLKITEPQLSQVEEASVREGPLSRSDKLAFLMARDFGWICWTSDANLKRRCDEENVRAIWGLEMMLKLARMGCLSGEKALDVARKIKKNGAYLHESVIEDFENKVRSIFEGR